LEVQLEQAFSRTGGQLETGAERMVCTVLLVVLIVVALLMLVAWFKTHGY